MDYLRAWNRTHLSYQVMTSRAEIENAFMKFNDVVTYVRNLRF